MKKDVLEFRIAIVSIRSARALLRVLSALMVMFVWMV